MELEMKGYKVFISTGLCDKLGKKIYVGDKVRIKGYMGKNMEYKYDCIYDVILCYYGVQLNFIKRVIAYPNDDSNQEPIYKELNFVNGRLTVEEDHCMYTDKKLLLTTIANIDREGVEWAHQWDTDDITVVVLNNI